MAGILYGIGIGPGDPELLTLKAVRKIQECDLILVPGKKYQDSVAYQIAVQAVPELAKKEIQAVVMPMTRDETVMRQHHTEVAARITAWLAEGRIIGFLNLGDITLYSTYVYIHQLVIQAGFQTEMINGIPSFCAAAARLNMGLVSGTEPLHILPVPEQVADGLALPGTKIIMKSGSHMGVVKEYLKQAGALASMVENCGMPGERVFQTVAEIPADAGYYSIILVKE